MLAPLTTTDVSIDILIACIWLVVLFRSMMTFAFTPLCFRMRIITGIIILLGLIYLHQVSITLVSLERADARFWDVFNGLVVFGSLIISTQWFNGKSVEWDDDLITKQK